MWAFFSPRLDVMMEKILGHSEKGSAMVYTGVEDDIKRAMLNHHYLIPIERSIATLML